MILSDNQERIILAALTELEERFMRGLANSHLSQATAKILMDWPPIHDSEVIALRKRFEAGR